MKRRSNQTTSSIARQLRVGVKRNHVANPIEQLGVGRGDDETRLAASAQQRIELSELPALAFPPDPLLFGLAPFAATMEKMKRLGLTAPVFPVERFDAPLGLIKDAAILRQVFS